MLVKVVGYGTNNTTHVLIVDGAISSSNGAEAANNVVFQRDAEAVYRLLYKTFPCGTFDRLKILMDRQVPPDSNK